MRPILSYAERQRNERIRQLQANKEKVSQNQKEGVNQGNKPMYLTFNQMDEVKRLQREEGYSRDEAVKLVLSNEKFK